MGVCLDKLPHSCGSSDGLQVFADEDSGKVNGYCFACGKFVPNPYGEEKLLKDIELPEQKSEEEKEVEMLEVGTYPTVTVQERKLRKQHLEFFDVKTSLSETDGKTPTAMFFPITKGGRVSGYYAKTLGKEKHQWSIGDVRDGDPFGWEKALQSGAYRLIIVEGREDAIATKAIFALHGNDKYMPAIISLSNGTNSVNKNLSPIATKIMSSFREVVLCFDDDKAGQEATKKALQILPNAISVTLPAKDPNDCLIKGFAKAAYTALSFNATKPKNSRLVLGTDLHEEAREPTPYGELTWFVSQLNKLMRNIRLGETIYLGAGVKMGKSEVLDAIAAHLIEKDNAKVMLIKPEQSNKQSYKKIAGKIAGKKFDDPDVDFDYEAFDAVKDKIGDKLVLLDLYQHINWEYLKTDIIEAANMGVKAVFIDPITNLVNGMSAADQNTKLQEIAQDLSAMAKDLNIVVFIFCHLKAPEGSISKEVRKKYYRNNQYTQLGNCPHELGGDVMSSQFAGSRAMMRSCNLMIGIEGNKDPELAPEVRNMRYLTILEDREFGNSARVPIYWNKETTRFKEMQA